MAKVVTTHTRTMSTGGQKVTAADLRGFLAGIPDHAEITIEVIHGDQREGTTTILSADLNDTPPSRPNPVYPVGVR